MNRDTLQGKWSQIKGNVRTKWGKLTNDDVEQAQGKFEALAGALQARYGMAKDKAEQEIDAFISSIDAKPLLGIAFVALSLLSGCASAIVATGTMDGSLASIRAAEEVGAPQVPQAKLHLQLAQEQTTRAKELIAKDEKDYAGFVLMRAQADAELALALARESNARGEAQQATEKALSPIKN